MCFIRTVHFTSFLFFYKFCYTSSSFNSLTYAASLNASEDIKHIFIGDHNVKDSAVFYTKGIPESGNFAEGGLLNVNSTIISALAKKNYTFLNGSVSLNVSSNQENLRESFKNSNNENYKNSSLYKLSTIKTLLPTKLNDTGSNLFLGVPEVVHINGASSIKPRKGVYFNKIVPRKGVENESEANHESEYLCVQLNKNECYDSKKFNDIDCKCCKQGNTLGKTIKQNYSVTCKNCKPVMHNFSDEKHICENICCYDKFHKAASFSNSEDIIYKNISFYPGTKFINNISSHEKVKESGPNGAFAKLTKSSKHKPNVTKVPYDVEVVTEILSKTKQKVFVPVIVSLLLLPLVGILVFVVLNKMKEIWDKRYYKRMDFLIDGMYQD